MRNSLFVFLIPLLFLTACSHSQHPHQNFIEQMISGVKANRTAVICVEGRNATDLMVEKYMVELGRQKGFNTVGVQEIFPSTGTYTVAELLHGLKQSAVDAIAEVNYEVPVSSEGAPTSMQIKYYTLPENPPRTSSIAGEFLNDALIALLVTLTSH